MNHLTTSKQASIVLDNTNHNLKTNPYTILCLFIPPEPDPIPNLNSYPNLNLNLNPSPDTGFKPNPDPVEPINLFFLNWTREW